MKKYRFTKRKIFDAHSHIGRFGPQKIKGKIINPFLDREIDSAKEQKEYMEKLGITEAIVMPHYVPDQKTPFDVYNPLVLDTILKLDNVYGALWVSPLSQNSQKTRKVLESLPIKKIVALKISPTSWPEKCSPDPATWNEKFRKNMEAIIETAQDNNLVIQTHTGSGNSYILEYIPFVKKYAKNLKIQFVHMGGSTSGHFVFIPLFIKWLKRGYDFYCDTSFCRSFAPAWLVREMQKEYPKSLNRILFGSDNPWGIFESEYWKVEAINCPEKIKEKIFYQNANRLYGK